MSGSDPDGFKLVSYKNNRKKKEIQSDIKFLNTIDSTFCTNIIPKSIIRINAAKEDLLTSDFYSSIIASLRETSQLLHELSVKEIVCFGLGKIEECMIARYQLAFLLCLKDLYKAPVYVFDPVHSVKELELLAAFDIAVLKSNSEGKYPINNRNTTLFYLPHCPKELSNNLLWSNWGIQLSRCIIISNSFNKIVDSNVSRILRDNAQYILSILPYVTELPIINCFKYYEIFNDTSVHIFPPQTISLISPDLWDYCTEPKYSEPDREIIRN